MKKWEYIAPYYSEEIEASILSNLGEDGWELVSTIYVEENQYRWIFKREKIEKATPVDGD